jgi:hypothetical protein
VGAAGRTALGDGAGDAGLLVAAETSGLSVGADVLWTIRPDHITVLPGAAGNGSGFAGETYPAVVDDVADIGTLTTLTVRLRTGLGPAPELRVRTTAPVTFAPGDACVVRLPPADITAWPAAPTPANSSDRDRLPVR